MPSILPGYEYDIFISYRQNDNRSDKWVTNFVNALAEELEATLKNPVSIYFDENPHDGLLETHQVDASLAKKLKCLVFISIISQTYCDENCFAWEHEFLPFIEMAKQDELGMNITLSNGNVVSRVLPVKIHDLDTDDQHTLEGVLDGPLRSIDFIYSEPGVNRPLAPEDNKEENLNATTYKNQINKVANALRDIGKAILKQSEGKIAIPIEENSYPIKSNSAKKGVLIGVMIVLIALMGYWGFKQYYESPVNSIDAINKSIAVLPFVNMSSDPEQEYFADGISEELINALAKIEYLDVAGRTSSFSYKGDAQDLKKIGEELGVKTILEGSVRKSGNQIRITAQLINTDNGFNLWTETYDRELTDIFKVQDEITKAILNELKVHLNDVNKKVVQILETNMIAYEIYLKARQKLALRGTNLYEAREMFERVIELDPTYPAAYAGLARVLSLIPAYFPGPSDEFYNLAAANAEKAIEIDSKNAEAYSVMGSVFAFYKWNWKDAEYYFKRSQELSPNDTEILNFLGDFYSTTWNPQAVAIEYRAMKLDPLHPIKQSDLSLAYQFVGKWDNAIESARRALQLDSNLLAPFSNIISAQCRLGQFSQAEKLIDGYTIPDKHIEYELLGSKIEVLISKGNKNEALQLIEELKEAADNDEYYFARVGELYLLLKMPIEAATWIEKAYFNREYYLVASPYIRLPEDYPDHPALRAVFNKPELKALFEIRRNNTMLKNVIM